MNRQEWAWLMIRGFGVYFTVLALTYLATLLHFFLTIGPAGGVTWGFQGAAGFWSVLLSDSCMLLIGLYLLLGGKLIFKLIDRHKPTDNQKPMVSPAETIRYL